MLWSGGFRPGGAGARPLAWTPDLCRACTGEQTAPSWQAADGTWLPLWTLQRADSHRSRWEWQSPSGPRALAGQHPDTTPEVPTASFAPTPFTASQGTLCVCEMSSRRDWDWLGLSPSGPPGCARARLQRRSQTALTGHGRANGRGTPKPARPLCLASPTREPQPRQLPRPASARAAGPSLLLGPAPAGPRVSPPRTRCGQGLQNRAEAWAAP